MSTTGYISPTSSAVGAWTNPDGAFTSNDTRATGLTTTSQEYGNYSFSIPAGSRIDGIEVSVEGLYTTFSSNLNEALSWDGGTSFTSTKSANFLTTEETEILGSSTDTWGRTWITDELSNANFRSRLNVAGGTAFNCDHIQIKIYYTEGRGIRISSATTVEIPIATKVTI